MLEAQENWKTKVVLVNQGISVADCGPFVRKPFRHFKSLKSLLSARYMSASVEHPSEVTRDTRKSSIQIHTSFAYSVPKWVGPSQKIAHIYDSRHDT